jgi:hypothetical protein
MNRNDLLGLAALAALGMVLLKGTEASPSGLSGLEDDQILSFLEEDYKALLKMKESKISSEWKKRIQSRIDENRKQYKDQKEKAKHHETEEDELKRKVQLDLINNQKYKDIESDFIKAIRSVSDRHKVPAIWISSYRNEGTKFKWRFLVDRYLLSVDGDKQMVIVPPERAKIQKALDAQDYKREKDKSKTRKEIQPPKPKELTRIEYNLIKEMDREKATRWIADRFGIKELEAKDFVDSIQTAS